MSGSEKIRVMFCIARLGFGGTERQLYHLAAGLDRSRFEPSVMTIVGGGEYWDRYQKLGVPIDVAGRAHKFDPTIFSRASAIVKKRQPHVVYSLLRTANFWGRIAGLAGRAPVIIGGERGVLRGRKSYEFVPDRILGKYSDLIIVNAPAVKDAYVKQAGLPADKVTVIPNGVDMELNRPGLDASAARSGLGIPAGAPVIGTVSRLHPRKGLEFFMDAARKVLEAVPEAWLLVAGDGPLRENLEADIRKTNAAGRVVFAGFREDVNIIMNAIDVFAFPSLTEGLPNTLVEAAACGRPIVACDNEENKFIVKDGETALLIPPGNAEAMEAALARLLRDETLRARLGAAARESVAARFSIHSMVASHEKLFESLYRGKSGNG